MPIREDQRPALPIREDQHLDLGQKAEPIPFFKAVLGMSGKRQMPDRISADVETWCWALYGYKDVVKKMEQLRMASADCEATRQRNGGRGLQCGIGKRQEPEVEQTGNPPEVWPAFTVKKVAGQKGMLNVAKDSIRESGIRKGGKWKAGTEKPAITDGVAVTALGNEVLDEAVAELREVLKSGIFRFREAEGDDELKERQREQLLKDLTPKVVKQAFDQGFYIGVCKRRPGECPADEGVKAQEKMGKIIYNDEKTKAQAAAVPAADT